MRLEFTTRDQEETVAQYLTAEFEMLHQRASQQVQIIANKVNFCLASLTAIVGGLIIASDNQAIFPYLMPVACVVLLFLFLVGWTTFLHILDLTAASKHLYRRAGRIRRWFVDLDHTLLPYLPFEVTDDRPRYYDKRAGLRGIDTILLLGNSAVAGALISLLLTYIRYSMKPLFQLLHTWIATLIIAASGLVVFSLIWLIQVRHSRKYLSGIEKEEHTKGEILYPTASDRQNKYTPHMKRAG